MYVETATGEAKDKSDDRSRVVVGVRSSAEGPEKSVKKGPTFRGIFELGEGSGKEDPEQ
jgi:hypothetical protein